MSVPAPWHLRGSAVVFLVAVPGRRVAATSVILVRYQQSPVGAYDELLWARKRRTSIGKVLTVDPIVVDSQASVLGGRANWGFPKQLAGFAISEHRGRTAAIVHGADGRVFADIAFRPRGPSLPVRSDWFSDRFAELVQERDGKRYRTRPVVRGRAHLTHLDRFELGPPFPVAHKTDVRMAIGIDDFELEFPPARVEPIR